MSKPATLVILKVSPAAGFPAISLMLYTIFCEVPFVAKIVPNTSLPIAISGSVLVGCATTTVAVAVQPFASVTVIV